MYLSPLEVPPNLLNLKTLLLLPVLALLLFGCKKTTHEPEPVIDPVSQVSEDKQFIHLKANGKDLLWVENDTISVGYYRSYSKHYPDSTLDRTLTFHFTFGFRFTQSSLRSGEKISLALENPIPARESVSFYDDECKYTKPAYIHKILSPGSRSISSRNVGCTEANIKANASLGYRLFDKMENTKIIYDERTTNAWLCLPALDQEGSSVEITSLRPFKHPSMGQGWMIDVTFKAKLYDYYSLDPKPATGRARVFLYECKD